MSVRRELLSLVNRRGLLTTSCIYGYYPVNRTNLLILSFLGIVSFLLNVILILFVISRGIARILRFQHGEDQRDDSYHSMITEV